MHCSCLTYRQFTPPVQGVVAEVHVLRVVVATQDGDQVGHVDVGVVVKVTEPAAHGVKVHIVTLHTGQHIKIGVRG